MNEDIGVFASAASPEQPPEETKRTYLFMFRLGFLYKVARAAGPIWMAGWCAIVPAAGGVIFKGLSGQEEAPA